MASTDHPGRRAGRLAVVVALVAGWGCGGAVETNRAYLSLLDGDTAAAARRFEAVVAAYPGADTAWRGLGEARFRLGQPRGAAEAFARAVALGRPSAPLARLGLVRSWVAARDLDRAATVLRESRDLALALTLARSAFDARDWTAAAALYRVAVDLAPRDWTGYYSLAVSLTNAAAEVREPAGFVEAESWISAGLRVAPGEPGLSYLLGQTAFYRGDYATARERFDAYVTAHPDDAAGWYSRGLAWRSLGAPMRAIEDLRRAIQLDDSALDARVYLAGELARTGHRQEAIALLDDVLRRSPQHAEGRAALDALRTAGR